MLFGISALSVSDFLGEDNGRFDVEIQSMGDKAVSHLVIAYLGLGFTQQSQAHI